MKLGFMSAALPQWTLDQVVDWASTNKFETLELMCWPTGDANRRYAGVTHIDVLNLTKASAARVNALVKSHRLELSALGYYPNPMHPDAGHREQVIAHLKRVIEAAALLEVLVVSTFVGRDRTKTIEQSLNDFAGVWPPIANFAAERGVRLAIENCPMIFSNDEWPGGDNLAHAPGIWRRMFEIIPRANFGLCFDPSHLVWQMIDVARAVREFGSRIFHVHAKDLQIDREQLYQNGILSLGMGWQVPRLTGLGDVQWPEFFSALYSTGYDGAICIEHEDRAFEGSTEQVQRGFLLARDVLRPLVH